MDGAFVGLDVGFQPVEPERAERVSEHELEALPHVPSASERREGVVAEVRAAEMPVEDLADVVDAGDGSVVPATYEQGLHVGPFRPFEPGGERLRVGRRRHPSAVQLPAGAHALQELIAISRRGVAQEDPPPPTTVCHGASRRARASPITCSGARPVLVPVGRDLVPFEVLVDLEEMLDLVQEGEGHPVDVLDVGPEGIAEGDAQDLLVLALLVRHPEQPDRTDQDVTARERGLADEHQGVERVAVRTERAVDEPVVRRVLHRREQHPVQEDRAGLVVELVLVPRPLGDLHDDGEDLVGDGHRASLARRGAIILSPWPSP